MTNPIEGLLKRYTERRKQKAERKREERKNALKKDFAERIQAKEFEGRMYLSVDGNPLIEADDILLNLVDAIQKVRNTIIDYKTK